MSTVTAVPIQPLKRGSLAKLLLGIALLVAAGLLLAWAGAGRMRGSDVGEGLIVRTVRPGHGPKVTINDGVMVNYTGRLTDGTIFDSNSGREPVPMLPAQVIPGFGKALTEMQKGGKYRIRIPGAQAYGATPPRGAPIPPNADLDFDVEIVDLVPNAALMAAQQAQQQAQMQQMQAQQQGAAPDAGAAEPTR
jgi:FKBP-type peptidyl-prolyl cis-trans isomerase FkpA